MDKLIFLLDKLVNRRAYEEVVGKVDRRAYEEVISKIVKSNDRKELMDQFSGDLVFYSSVLRDIARGKNSANYHVLNEWTKNKWLVERYIIKGARSVLSDLGIRELDGEENEVIGEYRRERFVIVPVVVKKRAEGLKRYVYLLSLLVLVIGLVFLNIIMYYGIGREKRAEVTGIEEVTSLRKKYKKYKEKVEERQGSHRGPLDLKKWRKKQKAESLLREILGD